jgi:hypothetical protein
MLVSNENPFVLWLNREDVSGGQLVSEPVSKDEFTISSVVWLCWSADSLPGSHTLASSRISPLCGVASGFSAWSFRGTDISCGGGGRNLTSVSSRRTRGEGWGSDSLCVVSALELRLGQSGEISCN